MDSDLTIHYGFSNYLQFETGTVSNASFIQNQPVTTHLLSFTYQIHFGDWGGIIIKILYCLFGLAPAILLYHRFYHLAAAGTEKAGIKNRKHYKPSLPSTNGNKKEKKKVATLPDYLFQSLTKSGLNSLRPGFFI